MILIAIIIGFPSCQKQDSKYEKYLVPNGLSYPGKALNPEAFPGRDRIKISWQNSNDPKVVKARISWNNDTKWEELNVNPDMDIISMILDDKMDEGDYSFMIRTYDDKGNVSVPVEVFGAVYGEMYERSLVNRSVKSILYNHDEGSLIIEWYGAVTTEVGMELEYTDINGDIQILPVASTETVTTIPDLKVGEPIFCTTTFKPDAKAIDVFQAQKVQIPYKASAPDTPYLYPTVGWQISSRGGNHNWAAWGGGQPHLLFDGNLNTAFHSNTGQALPQCLVIDMLETRSVNHLTFRFIPGYPQYIYVKDVEVYLTDTPVSPNVYQTSWGTAVGTYTNSGSEDFTITLEPRSKGRYLIVYFPTSTNANGYINFAELEVYTLI